MAACTTLVISFTFYNLAEVLFRLFSQDDAVVAVGVGMMHVLTPVYITYVCIEVLAGALRGCGDVRVPTLITVFFVCGLRMLWLFIAVPIRHEVATVEMSYPITWSLAFRAVYSVLRQGRLDAAVRGKVGEEAGRVMPRKLPPHL